MTNYEKLIAFRKDFHSLTLKKSGRNKFANYDYFELSDFIPAVINLCEKHKVTTQFTFEDDTAVLYFIDAESGEKIDFRTPLADAQGKGMLPIQALGSQHTYLRRYLYIAMLDIIENDGIEGQEPQQFITNSERSQLFAKYKGQEAFIQSALQVLGFESSSQVPRSDLKRLVDTIDELIKNA